MNLQRVCLLDTLCARAWAPFEQTETDGWVLRASDGFSLRANSVWPREARGGTPLAERIARVESFYADRGLPPRFQISPASAPPQLEAELQRRGYGVHATTDVMVAADAGVAQCLPVELLENAGDEWLNVMLESAADLADARGRVAIIERILLLRRHALAHAGEQPAAIGLGVIDDGWLGVFAMRTHPRFRRRGLARSVVAALRQWAAAEGAHSAYLQVEADNVPAIALYRGLGFVREYSYRYCSKTPR